MKWGWLEVFGSSLWSPYSKRRELYLSFRDVQSVFQLLRTLRKHSGRTHYTQCWECTLAAFEDRKPRCVRHHVVRHLPHLFSVPDNKTRWAVWLEDCDGNVKLAEFYGQTNTRDVSVLINFDVGVAAVMFHIHGKGYFFAYRNWGAGSAFAQICSYLAAFVKRAVDLIDWDGGKLYINGELAYIPED